MKLTVITRYSMKQTTIETRHLRTKIAAGYVLILLLVGGIVHTWLGEWQDLEELEAENRQINNFRKEVHDVYVRVVELSLLGETVLEWEDGDVDEYHRKRQEVDSLLCRFKSIYSAGRIDSLRHLLKDKEKHLHGIMQVFEEQESINDKIARRVPVIAWKSTQEEPKKTKRKGFLGLFGKKKEVQPTETTTMLYTLNRDIIAQQKAQSRRLSEHADSLASRNIQLNHQLQTLIHQMDAKVQGDFLKREQEIAAMREQSFRIIGGMTGIVVLLLLLSYAVIHRNVNRIGRYRRESTDLIMKLQKTVAMNKQLLTARRKIMLTVTHELRTPLAAINGYAELIPQAENREKQTDYIQNIKQSAGRMAAMLNSLLSFFRLDSGKEQAHTAPFRLQGIAETLRAEFEPLAEAKELTLHVATCEDIIVMGDRERLIQIGDNLLANAVKFTDNGTIGLALTYNAGRLMLTVKDTGTGISKEQQERIFDAFERLPNAAVQDGFGLGLSIVKNIVAILGGTIEVESKEGVGSCFTVTLPMQLASDAAFSKRNEKELAAEDFPENYSVLALDNDEMLLVMTKEMYARNGIHCDTCTTASDLMEAVRKRSYDLLITDLKMPEINGYDVLKLLRSSNVGNSQTIPVIVTTASGNCDEKSLLAHGFAGCLFKPFSVTELLAVSKRCIRKTEQEYMPDFSSLLACGNKDEMLDTLIAATEKEMPDVERAGRENNRKALDEWVHHLRSSWTVIRADKPLWRLHELLNREKGCTDEEINQAVDAVLSMGTVIIEQAKKEFFRQTDAEEVVHSAGCRTNRQNERSVQDEGICD